MVQYDMSQFYIDFATRDNLSNDEKVALHNIQESFLPIERVDLLIDYLVQDKITTDDFETMTGTPYSFGK